MRGWMIFRDSSSNKLVGFSWFVQAQATFTLQQQLTISRTGRHSSSSYFPLSHSQMVLQTGESGVPLCSPQSCDISPLHKIHGWWLHCARHSTVSNCRGWGRKEEHCNSHSLWNRTICLSKLKRFQDEVCNLWTLFSFRRILSTPIRK